MSINTQKLREEIEFITIHPEKHDQGLWAAFKGKRPSACGSFGCLAGNAVIHEGYDLLWKKDDEEWDEARQKWVPVWIADNVEGTVDGVRYADGTLEENPAIEDVAQHLFGLNVEQANNLFNGNNDVDHIWTLAIEYTALADEPITEEHRAAAFAEAKKVEESRAKARQIKVNAARKRLAKLFGEYPELKAEIQRAFAPVAW